VFAKFFHNWYFLLVLAGEFALQYFTTQFFPAATRTCTLYKKEWGACLMLGSTPLLISVLLKCTPRKWVEKFDIRIVDETKKMEEGGLVGGFNKYAAMQVGGNADAKDDDFKADGAEELATQKI
jgi:hypothetical protein